MTRKFRIPVQTCPTELIHDNFGFWYLSAKDFMSQYLQSQCGFLRNITFIKAAAYKTFLFNQIVCMTAKFPFVRPDNQTKEFHF